MRASKKFPPGLSRSSSGARLQLVHRATSSSCWLHNWIRLRQTMRLYHQTNSRLNTSKPFDIENFFISLFLAFLQTWSVIVVDNVCDVSIFFIFLSSVAADNASYWTEGLPRQYKYAVLAEKVSHSWSFFTQCEHNREAKWKWKLF